MTANSDWDRRVESLYQRTLGEPPERRRDLLDRECGNDERLQHEVERLVMHHDAGRRPSFQEPAYEQPTPSASPKPLPEHIGRYRILEKLGEGGMGVVYRAQKENAKRQVALKVIRPGATGRDALRRFKLEAAALARLKHPGIAQIYEAGTHDDGTGPRPFFAMELVEGLPLTAFAKEQALDTRAKLKLLADVCDAVQHAHFKGVIHRDLKPANILVADRRESVSVTKPTDAKRGSRIDPSTASPARPVPKVLDFGIARATDSDIQVTTVQTDIGQVVGTLPYISPEQVAGDPRAIDARSDVYSLGVILYELLAGRVPFDVADKTIAAAARTITDEDPVPLSAVDRAFRGDVNTIVLKALEKERERRYQSASDLAADLRRTLNDEPISARPITTVYQLRKFARRNRGLVVSLAAAFLILLGGVVVSTAFAIGQYRALNQSGRQRRIAEAINEFLNTDLLANASPANQPDRNVSLRDVLDRASERVAGRFPQEPLVEAAVRTTLADTYKGLGEYAQARVHAVRALELLETEGPEDKRETLYAMNRVGSLEKALGHLDEAEHVYRRGVELALAAYGQDDETTLSIMNNLALLLDSKTNFEEAASLLARIVEVRTRTLGEEHRRTMISLNNLAMVFNSMGRFDDAERLHRKELDLSRRVMGPEHPDTLISMNNLAIVYINLEEFTKAEPLVREALKVRTRVLGPDHPMTLESMSTLGQVLEGKKQFNAAEALIKETIAKSERVHGPEHPATLYFRDRLPALYLTMKRLDEAERLARASYEARLRVMGKEHAKTGLILGLLCRIHLEQGSLDEAEAEGLESYPILERSYGPKHHQTRKIAGALRDLYEQRGRPQDAARWLDRAEP